MVERRLFILILVLVLTLVGSVYTSGFTKFPKIPLLSKLIPKTSQAELDNAKKVVQDFFNRQGETGVEIAEVKDAGDLYQVTVMVQGQNYTSYMTKDLALFFPSVLDLKAAVAGSETEVGQGETAGATQEFPKSDQPEVQLFTMAFCPYGNQAEDVVKPVRELLGDAINLAPHYVIYEKYAGGGADFCIDNGNYCSMHGINELNQDLRELCVYNNQRSKYWDFVEKVNASCNVTDVETCWKTAATVSGVDAVAVERCFQANAVSYAKAEKALNDKAYPVQNPALYDDKAEVAISGSPTLVINGMIYDGARAPEAYKTAICSAFNIPPASCQQVLSGTTSTTASGGCSQ